MKWIVMSLSIGAVSVTFVIIYSLLVPNLREIGFLGGVIWTGVLVMALGLVPHYYRAANSYDESPEPVIRAKFRRMIGFLQLEILVSFLLFVMLIAFSYFLAAEV